MERCLECVYFEAIDECCGYCSVTGRFIDDPNISCTRFEHFRGESND